MPVLSIITINYNNATGLQKTIESVVNQSFQEFEYMVIDGGSSDGSCDTIKQYNRINYWVSKKDNGIYDAMNKGIAKATGDYVLFLNSGDELENVNVLLTVFSKEVSADILYGNMKIVHENGNTEIGKMPSNLTLQHMMRDTLWHPVSFIKKTFLHTVGNYDVSYKIVADYQWFLRALYLHKAKLKYIDAVISTFYLGGLSSKIENKELIATERRMAQNSALGENVVNDYYLIQEKKQNSFWKKLLSKLLK